MTAEEFLHWEQQSRDTIDFKRCYVDITGDLVSGILLSQIIFWFLPRRDGKTKLRVKNKEGDLCLAKNRDDWWEECRITTKQYNRAIKILQKKRFVSAKNSMFNGKKTPFIQVNFERIIEEVMKTDNRLVPKGTTDNADEELPITEKTSEKSIYEKNKNFFKDEPTEKEDSFFRNRNRADVQLFIKCFRSINQGYLTLIDNPDQVASAVYILDSEHENKYPIAHALDYLLRIQNEFFCGWSDHGKILEINTPVRLLNNLDRIVNYPLRLMDNKKYQKWYEEVYSKSSSYDSTLRLIENDDIYKLIFND